MQLIFNHVTGKTAADIGTDHAYIPIELIKSGKCERVIATDVRQGPAETAARHIKKQGLNIEIRVGSGLSVLDPGETEDIIIAGMGGKLICSILAEHPDTAAKSTLILQPMNGQYELRKFLKENNYNVAAEDLTVEGFKVYNLLVVKECENPVIYNEESDFHLPSVLKGHKYFEQLRQKKQRELGKILKGNENAKTGGNPDIIEYYKKMLDRITEK